MTTQIQNLSEQIEQTVSDFMGSLPEDDRQKTMDSFQKLHASATADGAVSAGDTAPDFVLPNAQNDSIHLYTMLNNGPVVLSFYRGGWCPFCNLEIRALQSILPDIKSMGASLVAVSPEIPDNSLNTKEKNNLEFEVLSDIGNATTRDYGLLFTVYEEMRPLYLKWGLDIPASNGDETWQLPVPATYIIDTNKNVVAAHVDKDYTKRMEPQQILAELEKLCSY
jgi:peroxiredoxin